MYFVALLHRVRSFLVCGKTKSSRRLSSVTFTIYDKNHGQMDSLVYPLLENFVLGYCWVD